MLQLESHVLGGRPCGIPQTRMDIQDGSDTSSDRYQHIRWISTHQVYGRGGYPGTHSTIGDGRAGGKNLIEERRRVRRPAILAVLLYSVKNGVSQYE